MPVTPSRSCRSTGTSPSGVKKKYSVSPSGVIKVESSAPAVLTIPGSGTGCSYSSEYTCGGCSSASGDVLTASVGMLACLSAGPAGCAEGAKAGGGGGGGGWGGGGAGFRTP